MRRLYTLLLRLFLPAIFLRLWLRGRGNPGYRQRWGERMGFFARPSRIPTLWVHAVSVGEVQAAAPLLKALRARYAQLPLIVTTTTPTGLERAQAVMGSDAWCGFMPYDTPGAVGRFLQRTGPAAVVIMETELWPNLFHACHERKIPLIIANARLSERSARGYRRVGALVREVLQSVSVLAAQSQADAQRFLDLGLPRAAMHVTGNLKFDLVVPDSIHEQGRQLRQPWGASRQVWIAASTHAGEEQIVLDAFAAVRARHGDALLILVPRHPERFDGVAELCRKHGYRITRRSGGTGPNDQTDIYLGDTLGELLLLYAAADVAFVGGSLVPVGGHNMLEPAALALPVLTGPHCHNFVEVTDLLLAAGAARQVRDADELAAAVCEWFVDAGARSAAGTAGQQLVAANKGALSRVLELIDAVLSR